MYIILTEAIGKDESINTTSLDNGDIAYFDLPVLRHDRYGKPEEKKVIIRYMPDSEFLKEFKLADTKTRRRYIAESMTVTEFITGKNKDVYLNA